MKHLILLLGLGMGFAAQGGGGSSIGPSNPASDYCGEKGSGWMILEDEAGNQYGFCEVQDAIIEEWTLFRHSMGNPSQATAAFLAAPAGSQGETRGPELPNPAAKRCADLGGEMKHWSGSLAYPTEHPVDLCRFADRSMIGAWTLLGGAEQFPRLAEILGSYP